MLNFFYFSGCKKTDREEILESLSTHKDLLVIDSSNNLRLKERHRFLKTDKILNVKGHLLSDDTMQFSVPAITIVIYMNPTLSFLAKPAMLSLCVKQNETNYIPKGEEEILKFLKDFYFLI